MKPLPRDGRASAHREIGTLPLSKLRRVTDYIREHLDQDLTLARLGAVVCMSPYHFARLFQRSMGLPPHRFVVRARIGHATTLLAAPELRIARIAQAVGFRTPSHFCTVFRRLVGVTPRAYRARISPGGPAREGDRDGDGISRSWNDTVSSQPSTGRRSSTGDRPDRDADLVERSAGKRRGPPRPWWPPTASRLPPGDPHHGQ